MKLILSKLNLDNEKYFLHWHAEEMFRAYLMYKNISVSQNKYGDNILKLNYNNVYHFYDIKMFPNRQGYRPTEYWEKVIDLFRGEGYRVETMSTYKWLNPQTPESKRVDGIRVWIYAKD